MLKRLWLSCLHISFSQLCFINPLFTESCRTTCKCNIHGVQLTYSFLTRAQVNLFSYLPVMISISLKYIHTSQSGLGFLVDILRTKFGLRKWKSESPQRSERVGCDLFLVSKILLLSAGRSLLSNFNFLYSLCDSYIAITGKCREWWHNDSRMQIKICTFFL